MNPIDGDLLILNGQTVSVAEGSVKQYRNIQINTGGVLQITGTTGAWTEIGCSGDCIVNGQIIARAGYDGEATHSGGSFSKTSAFGIGTLSYSVAQQNGGAGANGIGVTASAGRGGAQAVGIGGGGAGGGPGGNGGAGGQNGQSSSYPGGAGGGLGNGGNSINDGSGAYPRGGNGASGGGGGFLILGTKIEILYGGGGAGAYKGHHGKGLNLYVEGALSGIGSIICSGRAGFVGGAGVDFSGTGGGDGGGGGGGGGGAGGSGGSLILKYGSLVSTPSISVAGGTGGAGGSGNNAAGASGSSGLNGTYSLSSI